MIFKLVTYNIHRAIGLDRRFSPERIADIINTLNADIVMLQEVDYGVPRSNELDLAATLADMCNYPYQATGYNVSLKKGYYGNATLSRFPIVGETNIDLTVDNKKKRGCQHTLIDLDESRNDRLMLDVFNLHLGLSAKERQKQAGILFKSPEFSNINPDYPCIVGGDFNDWRSLLRALFIIGRDFQCATDRTTIRGNEKAIKTYPSFSPRGGLDRVYYRGGLKALNAHRSKIKTAKIASDHLPIVVTFELMKNGESHNTSG